MSTTTSIVKILDTTLRDGEQSPGCSMTPRQKLAMAHALAELGVDIIETGFPSSSQSDREATSMIAGELREVTVAVLSRCLTSDIEASARVLERAKKPRLHVLTATSPLHREFKLCMSREQVLESTIKHVSHARRLVDDVEFSAEDATRTEHDFLFEVIGAAIANGATTINVPDTLGYATPEEIRSIFRRMIEEIPGAKNVVFSAHCHDDLGLAVANSLAAIEGGARQVECTINGIGERAGNAALEELVMALKVRNAFYNADTNIDTRGLVKTSRLLQRLIGRPVQHNKAIVGENAFAHESGIHQHGMLKNRGTYEIMNPSDVGWPESKLVLGRHSGRAAVAHRLCVLGYTADEERLDQFFEDFKNLCEEKRTVSDDDLRTLFTGDQGSQGFQLLSITANSDGGHASARVELAAPGGKVLSKSASGKGHVDALFSALSSATGIELSLQSYAAHSVGTGADVRGVVTLDVLHNGLECTGHGTSKDLLEASGLAWLDVANGISLKTVNEAIDTKAQYSSVTSL